MRIFINKRNRRRIETDPRILKYNYRSRKGYSIKDIILEKRIACDNSIMIGYYVIHNIRDLQSCYDRYLVKISSLVQELIGVQ